MHDKAVAIELLWWDTWERAFIIKLLGVSGWDIDYHLLDICYRGDYDQPAIFVDLLFGVIHLGWCYGFEWGVLRWSNVK